MSIAIGSLVHKSYLFALMMVCGLVWAGVKDSYIGFYDKTPTLESFRAAPFCQEYGCRFQARINDNPSLKILKYTFYLSKLDGSTVQVETQAGEVVGLELSLPTRKALTARDVTAMTELVMLASGKEITFPFSIVCQQNQPGRPQNFGLVAGFLFEINCYRFPSIPEGTWEYKLKAWLPG